MFLVAILVIMGLAFPIVVSAQASATSTVVYTYDGGPLMMMHDSRFTFMPGDTTGAPKVLELNVPFTLYAYLDTAVRDSGIPTGSVDVACSSTLTGQSCTYTLEGTPATMWLDVAFVSAGYTEIKFDGNVIGRFYGSNPIFQPGDTVTTPKSLASNQPFVLVNYANRAALDARTPMGSVIGTCNSLMGGCTHSVDRTTAAMWVEILPASAVPAVTLTPTVTAVSGVVTPTATPNPLLGQGGGAVPTLAPQALPSVANQWTFTNNPASTNASQANWQAQLTGRGVLNPLAFVNHTPADNIPSINFVAAQHGMTIPSGDHTYGEQDNYLNIYSAARSIRYISADYNVPALGVECHQQNGVGCLLLIVNSGNTAVTFEDQTVYNGFSFEGEYFHGDYVGDAVWGLSSYGVLHMLNLEGGTNPGSNCAFVDGCNGVLVTVVGHSGGVIEWTGRMLFRQ